MTTTIRKLLLENSFELSTVTITDIEQENMPSNLRIFQVFNVFFYRLVPELGVAFINGIDFSSWLDAHIFIDQQELANSLSN